MQVDIRQAKTQLARLIKLVEEGETVVLARHGKSVVELVRARCGLPLGIASKDPLVPPGDIWWQPLIDGESEDWIEGR